MTASRMEKSEFAFGSTEWSNYLQHRPKYPASLIKLIQTHHDRYSNRDRYNIAHDVASGSGVFVPALVNDFGFGHVHVSDPGAHNIKSARRLLGDWLVTTKSRDNDKPHKTQPVLTFSQTTGEVMHTCTPAHTVDLVTIMMAAHWMDGPEMMASAAETLKPGGTLAIAFYCGPGGVKNNSRANKALKRAVGAHWGQLFESKKASNDPGQHKLERGMRRACVGLDWLAINPENWENVRRIRLRGDAQGEYPHKIPYNDDDNDSDYFAPSNVTADEAYEYYEEPYEEASGWERVVGKDWFYGFMASMDSPGEISEIPQFQDLLKVLDEEFPDNRITVEWTTDIVLASRR